MNAHTNDWNRVRDTIGVWNDYRVANTLVEDLQEDGEVYAIWDTVAKDWS
jgi:hypothetical protein